MALGGSLGFFSGGGAAGELELEELDRLMDVTQRQAKALQRMRQLLIDGAALPPPTGRRVLPAESLDADASSPLQR